MKKEIRTVNMLTCEGERFLSEKPSVPWNIYPRPHLKRESFFCLNGEWELSFSDVKTSVIVPFVPQSVLSGVKENVKSSDKLIYKKSFSLPSDFVCGRVLLRFGAVDQIAEVSLNGQLLGTHVGGYTPFSFDITDTLRDENLLCVTVTDELEKKILPYGKQREDRGGMWYTPISGIWQTVWLESVPEVYIKEIKVTTDTSGADISLDIEGDASGGVAVLHLEGEDRKFEIKDGHVRIDVDKPLLWSPELPHLYDFSLFVGEDRADSYFALRTLNICEIEGKKRLCLNGKPYFCHGLLDQGYFSDGIFLPAEPCGYERDILKAKELGFNMLRKHIKLEPETFYYDCDRLGMIVFQDMINNSDYSFFRDTALPTVGIKRMNDKKLHKNADSRKAFLETMEEIVKKLSFHPSVCYWTIFNEGWGQFDHASAYEKLKGLDDSRFIDSVSGWFETLDEKKLASDVKSLHVYFKPVKIKESQKPIVLSEFGGYSYKIEEHSFNLDNNYGYRTIREQKEFEDALEKLYFEQVIPAIDKGLCAAVYTQISDVEDETNGLMTYDRKLTKVDVNVMRKISDALSARMAETCTLDKQI